MSRTKCKKQTKHGLKRIHERCDLAKGCVKDFIKAASIHGFSPHHIPEGNLRNYLIKKEIGRRKRIKLYKGYVFIFNNTSNRLITMYAIPENLKNEFEEFIQTRSYLN